mmetsp:Transcript_21559/g.26460  ORF Transcript_21559/g.26460 Transcript_21559/m.26460 type:complete len:89 (+) Transcript_21559:476-742(+)
MRFDFFYFKSKQALQQLSNSWNIHMPNANYTIDKLINLLTAEFEKRLDGTNAITEAGRTSEMKTEVIQSALKKGSSERKSETLLQCWP